MDQALQWRVPRAVSGCVSWPMARAKGRVRVRDGVWRLDYRGCDGQIHMRKGRIDCNVSFCCGADGLWNGSDMGGDSGAGPLALMAEGDAG